VVDPKIVIGYRVSRLFEGACVSRRPLAFFLPDWIVYSLGVAVLLLLSSAGYEAIYGMCDSSIGGGESHACGIQSTKQILPSHYSFLFIIDTESSPITLPANDIFTAALQHSLQIYKKIYFFQIISISLLHHAEHRPTGVLSAFSKLA